MSDIKTLVTYLEMLKPQTYGGFDFPDDIYIEKQNQLSLKDYRYIYDLVGKDYYWVSRKYLSDAQLSQLIKSDFVDVYFIKDGDKIIGFFEINAKNHPRSVEISFIGLAPEYLGQGLGTKLAISAINQAWQYGVKRLIIQTCTKDHRRALPLYQKLGFSAYNRHVATIHLRD